MEIIAQIIFCVCPERKEGVVNSIIVAIAQTGTVIIIYGRSLPQRVLVLSMIRPESESSSASYMDSKKTISPYALPDMPKKLIIKNCLYESTNWLRFF